jgi:hypothetical protein
MNTNTPPIIRGEFVYHNVLLVDAGGDLKRHPRASLGDIKTLLDGKTPKDQVAHFYEAQLIHYGLQRSKDKNTAKVRLQQALNQKKLVVPPHIVDMENQMKKDFAASVRKANKSSASKAVDNVTPSSSTAPGRKRKQSGEDEAPAASSKKTKITMKVGDVEFTIDHDSNENTSGTSKKAIKTTATPKSKATPAPTAKQPKTPQTKKVAPQVDTKAKPTTKKATEVQAKSTATEKVTKAPAKPKAEKTTAVKKETKVKKEPTASSQAAPTAKATRIKQEKAIEREASPDEALNDARTRYITGVYNVHCPQLEDQSPELIGNLRIFLCADDNDPRKIWGGFELGWKSGVILMTHYDESHPETTFGWRARDLERGGLHFGKFCSGDIEFFDGGRIEGVFYHLFPEAVHFQAERRPGPLWCGKSAWQFEQEWDGFVAEAYGR